MLSFIRRLINSRGGVIITMLLLALIGLLFALGDIPGFGARNAATAGDDAATVGGTHIKEAEVKNLIEGRVDMFRRQQPELTMAQFMAQGGFDGLFDSRLTGEAMEQFGQGQGMRVGKPLIDNIISNIGGMRGLDGKVDKNQYNQLLGLLRLNDDQFHAQIGQEIITTLLLNATGTTPVAKVKGPVNLATPYATMLLEKRTGTVAFVDVHKMPAGAPVTDPEAQAYYKANIVRYTIPERRSARYALMTVDALKKRATPTDDEIAKAYEAQKATRFAAREKRSMKQVVLLDQKTANDLAAKVRGGTAIDVAAKAAGLEAATLADLDKTAYAGQGSAALADQVFGAASGAVIGPVKTPLGWVVVHLDKITQDAGKTLDQAKPDLLKEMSDQKLVAVAQDLRDEIDDAFAKHQTLDQVAAKYGLTVQSVTPVTANGQDPTSPTPIKIDENQTGIYRLAWNSTPDDDPQMVAYGKDGSFAIAKLDKVIPAAARPFAEVADQVKKDIVLDRQLKAARAMANAITAKVNKGMPLAQAMKETGIALDGTKTFSGNRAQLVDPSKPPQSQDVLLFNTPKGQAKTLQAPNKGGWFVIVTDTIERGDVAKSPQTIEDLRAGLAASRAAELRQQFIRSVRNLVGVKRNEPAIAALRRSLLGQGGDDQQQ